MKRMAERGFTLVEIMIVVAIIALLAAIAIPNVLRGRTTANESAAIGNLRAMMSSLEMFRSVNQVYPAGATWQAMYDATPGCTAGVAPEPDFGPAGFCAVMSATTPALIQGYNYEYVGAAGGPTYTIIARAQNAGTTGTRDFFTNETGVIRHCANAAAASTVAAGPNWPPITTAGVPAACT